MVRSYFEDYDSSSWKIIGLFTDKKVAEETAKKTFMKKKHTVFSMNQRVGNQHLKTYHMMKIALGESRENIQEDPINMARFLTLKKQMLKSLT